MAKKKSNTQTETNPHKPQDKIHHHQPMDDVPSEKLDSLKLLNAMLLKETVERRQQVDSLIQSNGSLVSELNRSVMEKDSLHSQLNAMTERAAMMEIENGLVSVFATVQVNQLAEVSGKERDGFCRERVAMEEVIEGLESDLKRVLEEKSEIEKARSEKESEILDLNSRLYKLTAEIDEQRVASTRVCDERDDFRVQLDAQIQEANGLRLKMIEVEKRETGILSEFTELKVNYDRLVKEKTEIERRSELILSEKDSVQRSLVELNGQVDDLKRDIDELIEQKKVTEEENNMQQRKNDKLQISVGELKDLVQSMKLNEASLLEKVSGLEKRFVESLENEVKMRVEINGLVEEKKETEEQIQSLLAEKGLVTKDLEDALKMLEHQKLTIEQIVQEKTEMEDAKIQGESEIVKMKEQLVESKSMILSLEKSVTDQIEKLKQLEAEVNHYRASFDQAIIERNDARESLDEEKTNRNDLQEKILKIEKEMEDLREELKKMTTENGKHLREKNELEDRCSSLVKDLGIVEVKFAETQKEFDDTKAKLGLAEANSNMVLNILKNWDENTVLDRENGIQEGVKDHVTELEAIKRAFKDKDSRVEDMKRQLELLKSSVAEAHKGKSFWTMVSSATTVLAAAAASVAYVARGH